ncbi:MAG: FGGY-family carbohydrate kinase [Pseudomonadota bacterium]
MADRFLSIDLGTTSVKAGVFSDGGRQLDAFAASYASTRTSDGRCEQDPGDWMRLIDAALETFDLAGVRGGALTSQVNTHVFVDAAGAPLMPAITWQDTRAAAEAAELDAIVSAQDKIAWLGAPIPIDASHPLSRMKWVARHRPDVWQKTAHVLLPKDFALWHLTGARATDPLSNFGLVGPAGRVVPELAALVPGAAERLLPVRPITDVVGETRAGVPMANASMDGWVGLLGAGACREGAFVYLSGTSEILGAASQTVTNAPGIVVFCEAEGLRLHAGPTQSGGASAAWFCEAAGVSLGEMAGLAAGADGRAPLFLPQLSGERAPLWQPHLRGAFLGLDGAMGPGELARAVYEGVALSARHVLGAMEASAGGVSDRLMCGGGGFAPHVWGQIRADILQRPLERLAVREAGLLGAAAVAIVASGAAPSLAHAHRPFERFDATFEPDPAQKGRADDLFGIYCDAIAANASLGERLGALPV